MQLYTIINWGIVYTYNSYNLHNAYMIVLYIMHWYYLLSMNEYCTTQSFNSKETLLIYRIDQNQQVIWPSMIYNYLKNSKNSKYIKERYIKDIYTTRN